MRARRGVRADWWAGASSAEGPERAVFPRKRRRGTHVQMGQFSAKAAELQRRRGMGQRDRDSQLRPAATNQGRPATPLLPGQPSGKDTNRVTVRGAERTQPDCGSHCGNSSRPGARPECAAHKASPSRARPCSSNRPARRRSRTTGKLPRRPGSRTLPRRALRRTVRARPRDSDRTPAEFLTCPRIGSRAGKVQAKRCGALARGGFGSWGRFSTCLNYPARTPGRTRRGQPAQAVYSGTRKVMVVQNDSHSWSAAFGLVMWVSRNVIRPERGTGTSASPRASVRTLPRGLSPSPGPCQPM